MDRLVEPEVKAARLAQAWRQVAGERFRELGIGPTAEPVNDSCASDLAHAMVADLHRRHSESGSPSQQRQIDPRSTSPTPSRLSVAAARFGATRALNGGSLYDLVADLMSMESAALRIDPSDACAIHAACECALLAGTAAFTRAVAELERKRVREVRHDLTNAVGTVRNAIVLMDEEPAGDARGHFLEIARRNTVAAQDLVREHLSEATAVPAWLDCSRHVAPCEQPAPLFADSAREEGHDLAGSNEREHGNAELR